jgi:acetyltransferase-like isoleucine patch superfamily enzyme
VFARFAFKEEGVPGDEHEGVGARPRPWELEELDPIRRRALLSASRLIVKRFEWTRRDRVTFGTGVIANHRLVIRGPGRVIVGDRANLYAFGNPTRLVARTPKAVIRIGENARLNGPFLQADTLIEVGPDCILGECHLLDTDMHSLARDRRTNPHAEVRTAPVVLEANVWVARGAAILPGVRIGRDSVIGYGAVVAADVPAGVVAAGNPAKVIRTLP